MGAARIGDGLIVQKAIAGRSIDSGLFIGIDSNLNQLHKDADRVLKAFGAGTKGKA